MSDPRQLHPVTFFDRKGDMPDAFGIKDFRPRPFDPSAPPPVASADVDDEIADAEIVPDEPSAAGRRAPAKE